jgi:site-specific DNA-methyltransferase (adenine-specific)
VVKYLVGEEMTHSDHLMLLYSAIDQSASLYQTELQLSYFEGICKTCENILADDISEADVVLNNRLKEILSQIRTIEFTREEIRKAMVFSVLKGMKTENQAIDEVTPDTIGVFLAHLIDLFFPDTKELIVFDPLVGIGNLLATIANHLRAQSVLVGVDHVPERVQLARALMGMLEYEDQIYCQDTMTFRHLTADVMVSDFPAEADDKPEWAYEVLHFHHTHLREGAIVLAIVFEDFFDEAHQNAFKKLTLETYEPLGLIQLPKELFVKRLKSILILRKKTLLKKPDTFLLAQIPSFTDTEAMSMVMDRIHQWFEDHIRKDNHNG